VKKNGNYKLRFLRGCVFGAGLVLAGPLSALVFSPAQLDGTNGFTANGPVAFDFTGRAVSSAGDINGDGIDDVMVGAYGAADLDRGDVYVIFGQDTSGPGSFPSGIELTDLDGTDGFVINGVDASERVGTALASLGDINADGLDDILIGAKGNAESDFQSGAAYVVYGRDTTQPGISFPASFDLSDLVTGGGADGFVMYGAAIQDEAGQSVTGDFDLNGDGINDLAVGAPGTDVNGSASGEVYVIFGRDTGVSGNFPQTQTLPDLASGTGADGFVIRGGSANARAGISVASVGDVNADGFGDLIIGAYFLSDAANPGQAYVIFGRNTSVSGNFPTVFELSTLAGGGGADGFVLNGLEADDTLGEEVGAAGDVDGDGIDDLIVADPRADNNGNGAGQAYVVFGRDTAMVGNFPGQFELSTLATGAGADGFVLNGRSTGSASTGAGRQVGSAGDFNGDGITDFFVSDGDANGGAFASGEVYILFGRDTSMAGNFAQVIELADIAPDPGPLGLVIQGQDSADRIGDAVSLAGDVNDDGILDLIIGAGEADPNGGNSGEAYVIFGPGRDNTPPTVTAPPTTNGFEDVEYALGPGYEIADGEGDDQTVTISLQDQLANLNLDPVAGVTINGNGTPELTFSGALADINIALPLVTILGAQDSNGGDFVLIDSNDGFFVDSGVSSVFIQPVNDPPVLTIGPDPVEVLEDGGQIVVEDYLTNIGPGDPEQGFFEMTFDELNDNNALFDSQPRITGFEWANGTANLFMVLNPEISGTATVQLTATDGNGTNNGGNNETMAEFDIVVLPVNDPPTFTLSGDIEVSEDATITTVTNFATGMDDGDPFQVQALSFSLESDNPSLFSVPSAIDMTGELTYTLAPDANGSAIVTVTLNDDGGTDNGGVDFSSQNFTLTVNPVNDQPSFTVGDDVEVLDIDGAISIPNWATDISPGPANESGQMVSFEIVSNSAPGLFSAGPVVSPAGTLSFTPVEFADGIATIELRPIDDGPTGQPNDEIGDTQSFMITITEAPSADLSISKSNGVAFLGGTETVVWTITVENLGSEDVTGAEVEDLLPSTVTNGSWTCLPSGGASCMASGTGDIIDIVDIPAGSSVVYELTADLIAVEGDVVENTAVVIPPESTVDRNLQNNSATDSDPVGLYFDGFETE